MRRSATAIPPVPLVSALASLMMTAIVLAGGLTIAPLPSPSAPLALQRQTVEPPPHEASTCLEAPVTAHTAPGVEGLADLCITGRDVSVRFRVDGVTTGRLYTAWFSYVAQPADCRDQPCGPADLLGDAPLGLLEQVASGIAPPSRRLELAGDIRDLDLASGAQVTLLLLRPRGPTGLHSQAVFIIP